MGPMEIFPVVISAHLIVNQEEQLLFMLPTHKGTLAWNMEDVKDMVSPICRHQIALEDDAKPNQIDVVQVKSCYDRDGQKQKS